MEQCGCRLEEAEHHLPRPAAAPSVQSSLPVSSQRKQDLSLGGEHDEGDSHSGAEDNKQNNEQAAVLSSISYDTEDPPDDLHQAPPHVETPPRQRCDRRSYLKLLPEIMKQTDEAPFNVD